LGPPFRGIEIGLLRRPCERRLAAARRVADSIVAVAWPFRLTAAAFGSGGQQKAPFCTWNCFVIGEISDLE